MVDRLPAPDEARLLDHLYGLAGCADPDFAADLLLAFLDSTRESGLALDAALTASDRAAMGRAAHRLKSSFATLAMDVGSELCAVLESSTATAHPGVLAHLQEAVRVELTRERTRVERLLGLLEAADV